MDTRVDRQRERRNRLLAALALSVVLCPAPSFGEYRDVPDIKSFGLLDVSGQYRIGYIVDDREFSSSAENRTTWEQEFFLLTKSFVYHPGFLNMDLGGGPILAQTQLSNVLDEASQNDALFNFLARLNFLELKKYPFSLHFERSHPSVTSSIAGRFLTQNDAYGIRGRIFDMLGGSTALRFEASRRSVQGSSLGSVVDENTDLASILIETNYRDTDKLVLSFDRLDTGSASGSLGLPIFQSIILQDISEIRSRNRFGREKNFEIYQTLRRLQQETRSVSSTALDDWQYRADLRWQHTDKTQSFFRLRQFDTKHTFSRSKTRNLELGVVQQTSENFNFDSAIEYSSAEQTGFSRDLSTLRGSFNYTQDVGFGTLGLSGSLRGSRTDQTSSADSIPVFDEIHVLNDTTPVELVNSFVVDGSVMVSNAGRTQIFTEGLDYRLVVIGSVTAVQRLIAGNINDGETVTVDYSYEPSGTAEFDTLGSAVTVNVSFLDTLGAYLRYDSQDTRLRIGEFTNPVNDNSGLELGLSASNQIFDGWSVTGQYRHRSQDEEISPYISDTLDISLTTSLRGTWKVTVSGSRAVIDYEKSAENVNLVTYRLALRGRLLRSVQMGYDAAYLNDTGGVLARKQVQHRLNVQWAYRRVRMDLRALYSQDGQGGRDRAYKQVTVQLTRVF
jgi:hypothetical protein